MLYNERLLEHKLDELHASKATIPSLSVEEKPTGQVTKTDVSVASESNSVESATSHEKLNESDTDEQGDNSADDPVPAATSSTVVGGSSISELAIAVGIAGTSLPEDNAQLSEDETSWQATPHEAKESMQQDSDVQPQDAQSEILTEFADVKGSPESNDTEEPEEDGGTNDRSGKSTSSVGAS
ncbi:trans-sialidase, putative, partial [Trypanosoma cruzi]